MKEGCNVKLVPRQVVAVLNQMDVAVYGQFLLMFQKLFLKFGQAEAAVQDKLVVTVVHLMQAVPAEITQ